MQAMIAKDFWYKVLNRNQIFVEFNAYALFAFVWTQYYLYTTPQPHLRTELLNYQK